MGSIEGVGVQKNLVSFKVGEGCSGFRVGWGAFRAGLGVCWGFLLHFGFLWASGVVGFLGFFL